MYLLKWSMHLLKLHCFKLPVRVVAQYLCKFITREYIKSHLLLLKWDLIQIEL